MFIFTPSYIYDLSRAGHPIRLDLGVIYAEPETVQHLGVYRGLLSELLVKHERQITSEAMESSDHYQNLATAPKKQMTLSVYRIGD